MIPFSLTLFFRDAFTFIWDARRTILGILIGLYIGYFIGHWARGIEGEPKAVLKSVSQDISIKEKQDEIRNNRPDRNGVIKRLQSGTF